MKATNIYQTLKTKGYGTDGTKPQLPGVGSPLKKSPYKFNAGLKKAAAEGKLNNNPKFKNAVEGSPAKLAPVVAAVGKKLLVGAAKKMIAKKAAEKLQQKQGSPAMMKGKPKKDSKKVKKIKAGVDKAASELHDGHMIKSGHYNEFSTRDSDGVRLSEKIYKKNPKNSAYYKAVDNSLTSTVRNLEHKRQEKVGVPKTKDKPHGEFRTYTRPKDQFKRWAGKTTYTGRGYGSEPEDKKKTADYKSYKAATSPAKKHKKASPAKKKDNGKKPKLISKVTDKKTGVTTAKYDVGTNMPKIVKTKASPAKKKSCRYKK